MSDLQEDAKKLLPFVQAMAEGKTVQYENCGTWIEKRSAGGWQPEYEYRIKPEPKLRPYTRDELERRVDRLRLNSDGNAYPIGFVADTYCSFVGLANTYAFEKLPRYFTHLDGSPCGVLEE